MDLPSGFWISLLIFSRVAGLVSLLPVFSSESLPYRFRFTLAIFLTFLYYPLVGEYLPKVSLENFYFFLLEVVTQLFIGLFIGLMIQMVFSAFVLTGELFSIQMGVSFSEVLDPQSQISFPVIGSLKNLIAMLLFLSVDFEMDGYYMPAYLHLFRALHYSFVALPTVDYSFQTLGGFVETVHEAFRIMFLTAIKIGMPLAGILFITSVALGIAGKTSPQLNLLNLGIQFQIAVGFLVLLILMPVVIPLMRDSFAVILQFLGETFRAASG